MNNKNGKAGSALLVTILITSLLLVMALAFSLHVQMSSREITNHHVSVEAKFNAKLALEIAISQLQQYAGADQRVTAPATAVYPNKNPYTASGPLFDQFRNRAQTSESDSFLQNGATYLTPNERSQWNTDLTEWWENGGNPRNPHWVGVVDSSLRTDRNTNPANPSPLPPQRYESDPDTTYGEFHRNQLPIWLISGNEQFNLDPQNTTSYPAGYLTPETPLPDPETDSSIVYLVNTGSATLSNESSDGLDGRIRAKKQPIRDSNPGNSLRGQYAWWIGDESMKANFSLFDPFSQAPIGSVDYRNRLQVPQRLGWERMEGLASIPTDPNDPNFLKVTSSRQIPLVHPDLSGTGDLIRRNFHQLTARSASLLTDTALGGLKKDLTVFFEGSGSGISVNDPIPDKDLYEPNDPRFGQQNTGFPNGGNVGLPTWLRAKDWYDSTTQGNNGSVSVRPGRAPVFTQQQILYAVTHKNGRLQFHIIPYFVLWNPWDTALESTTYTLECRFPVRLWKVGFAQRDASNSYTDPFPDSDQAGRKVNDYVIRPVQALGWYTNSDQGTGFTPQRSMTTSSSDFNSSNTTHTPINPVTGFPYTYSELNDLPYPDYQLKVMDSHNGPGSGHFAEDPETTFVNFQFTTRFEAGQTKIFTVTPGPGGNSIEISGGLQALHEGTAVVDLSNDFDADFPASFYWDFGEFVNLSTYGLNTPTQTDTVRWTASFLAQRTLSIKLNAHGQELWFHRNSGSRSGENGSVLSLIYFEGRQYGPNASYKTAPETWREIHHLDRWESDPALVRGDRYKEKDSPTLPYALSYMTPLTPQDTQILNPPYPRASGYANYYRAFATYNLGASSMDLPKPMDEFRGGFNSNNTDKSSKLNVFTVARSLYGQLWNQNQIQLAPNGDMEAFSLISWKENDGRENMGITSLPIKSIRRADSQLLSLGQLQQVNFSPYFWQPGFVLGNSEATPYVDRNKIGGIEFYEVGASNAANVSTRPNNGDNHYLDMSYLLNEAIWDRYFLSTIPQSGSLDTILQSPLSNSRHHFTDAAQSASGVRDLNTAAAYLQNRGALNVNTTNREAWRALLTAFRDLRIEGSEDNQRNPENTVPVSRNLEPLEGPVHFTLNSSDRVQQDYGAVNTSRDYSKMFKGYRFLTDDMIDSLAERIVDEVRLRGPFYSLADFINRRLAVPDGAGQTGTPWHLARTTNPDLHPDNSQLTLMNTSYKPMIGLQGLNGTLQRAINLSGINGGVNDPSPEMNDRVFRHWSGDGSTKPTGHPMILSPNSNWFLDSEHMAGAPVGESGSLLSHTPGFVTQGDLLTMLAPALTARGDTFLIRTYGEKAGLNGEIQGKAWLEAVVQRVVEPLDPAGTTGTDQFRPTSQWGRRFKIVSLRWLLPEEV